MKWAALWSHACVIMEGPPGLVDPPWLANLPQLADPPLPGMITWWLLCSAFTLTKRTCLFSLGCVVLSLSGLAQDCKNLAFWKCFDQKKIKTVQEDARDPVSGSIQSQQLWCVTRKFSAQVCVRSPGEICFFARSERLKIYASVNWGILPISFLVTVLRKKHALLWNQIYFVRVLTWHNLHTASVVLHF